MAAGVHDGARARERLHRVAEARQVGAHALGARGGRLDDVDGAHLAPRREQLVDDVTAEQARPLR